jgi:hypothetical protein
MRIITFIFFIALFCSDTFGQANVYGNNRIVYYYSLTDFSNIDTLEYWNYKLDLTNKPTENDTVKPIGLLTFYRTKSIDDSISLKTYYNTPQLLDQKVRDAKLIFRVVLGSILV